MDSRVKRVDGADSDLQCYMSRNSKREGGCNGRSQWMVPDLQRYMRRNSREGCHERSLRPIARQSHGRETSSRELLELWDYGRSRYSRSGELCGLGIGGGGGEDVVSRKRWGMLRAR